MINLIKKYEEIASEFDADIESISTSVHTYRIKVGRIVSRLEDKVSRLEDTPKQKRAFKAEQWDKLKIAHSIENNEIRKALRLYESGILIQDANLLTSLPYNHLCSGGGMGSIGGRGRRPSVSAT